jgi:hypothetical protein
MNTCMAITCSTCELDTDCRIGYSIRLIQPIQFACPHCLTQLQITLDISEAPRSNFSYNGCEPSKQKSHGPFTGVNPFVDLHLDFPVKYGKYVMGETPWLSSLEQVKKATGGDGEKAFELFQIHANKLHALNQLYPRAEDLKRIINLYHGNNKQLFQQRAAEFLNIDQEQSTLPQDMNATLYRVIANAFFPFVVHEHGREISEELPRMLHTLNGEPLNLFIKEIFDSGFMDTIQRDCLRIYPKIFDAEMSLRPALFLDLIKSDGSEIVAGRVSSSDFFGFKDLYKDILETIGRQLVLLAGINNLHHRGGANSFRVVDGGSLSSLQKFSEKTLSDKFKYLDDCWYNLSQDVFNLGLRNAIAHNNVRYDEALQIITYFPDGGRLEKTQGKNIAFLEFMHLLLVSFREMHNLHHIIKCLFYYKFLVYDQPHARG